MAKIMNHKAYQAKVKDMTISGLHYTMADAHKALQAMPDSENAGYYQDEINYCGDELHRRHDAVEHGCLRPEPLHQEHPARCSVATKNKPVIANGRHTASARLFLLFKIKGV